MPAIRSSSSAAVSGTTAANVSASAVDGDLAIIFLSSDRGTGTSATNLPSVGTPTGGGWTEELLVSQGFSGTVHNNAGKMFSKPVTSTGTFSTSSTSSGAQTPPTHAHLFILSDAVLDDAVGFAIASAVSAPATTASGSGELLLCHILYGDPKPGAGAPTGMTSVIYTVDTPSSLAGAQTWYQANVGPGSTGTKSPTGVGTSSGVSMSAVFKAASRTGDFMPFFGAI